jgi:hypothetical protein
MELESKAQDASGIETGGKSAGVPSALLAALEESKPTPTISQKILNPLSKTSQTVYKSLSSLVNPYSTSLAFKTHDHGVPTGLFRLPLEIRQQIYGLVLGHNAVLKIPENYHKPKPSKETSNTGPTAILQTCRQM